MAGSLTPCTHIPRPRGTHRPSSATLPERAGATLITVSAAGRPQVVSVQATIEGGLLRMGLGRRTAENTRNNPAFTLVWQDGSDDDYCLMSTHTG